MNTLTIDGVEHEINDEVANLVLLISNERDELKNNLKADTESGAQVPCSGVLSDLVLRVKLMKAFMDGYEAGHNDTVESAYSDAEDRANDWLDEQEEEGR